MKPNPEKAKSDWPQVVVAGAHQTGVNLMRNLVRRGVKVSCFDCLPDQPGFRTVYGQAFCCPDPDTDGESWLTFMVGLSRRIGGKPVLIPAADIFVSAMAKYGDELENFFTFYRSALKTQALLATKERQYELAASHEMPVPRFRLIKSSEEAATFASNARFPCLFKPMHFRLWEACPPSHPLYGRKVLVVHTPSELVANYQLCSEITSEVVVQELIEGPETAKIVYLSCYGRDGNRIGSYIVRELRAWPIGFGSATAVESVADEEANELCDRFLRRINYLGLCEIELKRDSRDGRLQMIEANPRHTGTGDAAPYAGVELGWLHYLDLIGISVTEVHPCGRSFRHIVLIKDLAAIRFYRREGLLSWSEILRSYQMPVAFYDLDCWDWKVALRNLYQIVRVLLGSIFRIIFPKRPKNSNKQDAQS